MLLSPDNIAEKAARDVAEMKARADVKEWWERNEKMWSGQYDKARAYSNLIVVAGYAGFFALWSIAKPYISTRMGILAILLMSVSIAIFIAFEIIDMMTAAVASRRRAKMMTEPPADYPEALKRLKNEDAAINRDSMRKALTWPWSFGLTLFFGVAGSMTLFHAFLVALINQW